MRLDVFMLADAAAALEGRLFVHGGGITRIDTPVVPGLHPQLALVARFIVEPEEVTRSHEVAISLKDPDDNVLIPPANFDVPAQDSLALAEGEEAFLNLTLTFGPIPLSRAGVFVFELSVDGDLVRSMSLPVVERREAAVPKLF